MTVGNEPVEQQAVEEVRQHEACVNHLVTPHADDLGVLEPLHFFGDPTSEITGNLNNAPVTSDDSVFLQMNFKEICFRELVVMSCQI